MYKKRLLIMQPIKSDQKQTTLTPSYLLQPTGQHYVGYQDIILQKLNLRIYYPSDQKLSQKFHYNPKGVAKWQADIRAEKMDTLEIKHIESLSQLTSYSQEKLRIIKKKCPVIYFAPGMDSSSLDYENILCELASHGYIIVGLDNTNIQNKTPQKVHRELMDIYQHIRVYHHENELFLRMDLNRIGLLGHSLGGVAVILAAQQQPHLFHAMAALDAPADLPQRVCCFYRPPTYDVRQAFSIPAMQMHSATWLKVYSAGKQTYTGKGRFLVGKNGYHVVLSTISSLWSDSDHNNFCDRSTLQKHPAIQAFNNDPKVRHKYQAFMEAGCVSPLQLGSADGYQIARTINQYIIGFYATFLQQEKIPLFLNKSEVPDHSHFLAWSKPQLPEKAEAKISSSIPLMLDGIISRDKNNHKENAISLPNQQKDEGPKRCPCVIL